MTIASRFIEGHPHAGLITADGQQELELLPAHFVQEDALVCVGRLAAIQKYVGGRRHGRRIARAFERDIGLAGARLRLIRAVRWPVGRPSGR